MSSMKEYLASKYMSGPKADAILSRAQPEKKKKKKPKAGASSSTATPFLHDEDAGWGQTQEDEDEGMTNVVVERDTSFKKRQTNAEGGEADGWTTIREPTPPPAVDEEPLVVEETMARGGLVTASQLRKALPKTKEKEKEEPPPEQETVYRDASGRKIDTKAERADAARRKREWEEKQAQKMEWGKGLVQREDAEARRKEEEKERTRGLARYVDDEDLNDMQKAQDRWNDPAAAFLSKKKSKGPKKPEYKGPPPPPNRFGIKPGYRWDGVDRGNGFEKKIFQKANDRSRRGLEAYQWSVDEM